MAAKSAKHGWGTKFTGKTFAFAGKTWNVDQYKELVTSEGGNVVDDVSAKLDYLILGRARGKTAQEKEAEKLNAKSGAAIQVLSETDFLAMVAPSRDEAIAMLKGGLDDLEHWNRLTRLGQVPMPDLSHADLRGVKFAGRQVVLSAVTIDGADFGGADLSGCHFVQLNQVNLDGANLSGVTACQISDCTFRKANLTEARISQVTRCDFSGAILHRIAGYQVKMVDCIFRDADLTGAAFAHSKFSGMDFVSSTLKNSQLSYADFRSSQLAGVNLSGADLSNANLQSADLSKADLSDACLLDADLTAAIIDDADFSGANIAGANLHGLDARKAKGLDPNKATALRVVGPNIQDLENQAKQAKRLDVSVTVDLAISYVELQVTANAWGITSNANEHKDGASSWQPGLHGKPIRDCMQYFARRYRDGKLRVDSVTVRAQKAALAGKELKRLVRAAWCEAFGVEIPTEEGLQIQTKEKKEKQTALREELLAELRGGAKGVRKWNARKLEERKLAGSFRRVDLTGFELAGVDLQDLDFQDSNFDKADLSGAKIVRCKLGSASFKGANLENIQASAVKATGANFGGASLRGASLQGSTFKNSVFENANLDKADLMYCDLCGADLRSATHKDASFAHIKFDELTRLPKGFDFANTERWVGKGVDPRIAKAVAKKPRGPIDLPKFLKRLEANTEAAKLEKAVSMLKADRFKLYAQVADDFLVGVVKSQTDQDLVYSCRLGADGVYGCCTQNLNICGGLRGSLCKHLLVLIIGLANGNELDLGGVDGWIAASRLQKPVLDKEAMSETFLRYKGAEAGEVDWRPTETIPEDYYAL